MIYMYEVSIHSKKILRLQMRAEKFVIINQLYLPIIMADRQSKTEKKTITKLSSSPSSSSSSSSSSSGIQSCSHNTKQPIQDMHINHSLIVSRSSIPFPLRSCIVFNLQMLDPQTDLVRQFSATYFPQVGCSDCCVSESACGW